ncbi:hypothetical protein [Salmonella enterica]|uniref:hypothetical protein n=1 Tax=Salmonella TaxID=590 RepID=UPI0007CDBCB3|nr:hypothetical protein [Salmonella enterica]ANF79345.1 hypothetical protein A7P63_17750 [Salmonella enterica]MCH5725703.1 hypothetical protein [Salmonella enterica]MCQ7007402.1 hypothetical protein [Salmonella enterica]MCQ7066962.1 hypothetical protein [Salmonella enterica]MCQ7087463.1 hypothetical protein [Salmonella enterica]
MSVKRYEWVACDEHACHCDVVESAEGDMVDYDDYAALEARCAALAAENAGLKSFGDKLDEMHNDLNGEGTGIQGRAEVACQQAALEAAMEEFDAIKTPATDTFLAEVRVQAKADGVQEYADSFRHSASKIRECHGDTIRVRALLHEASNADEFAAQLRKGVQS